MDIMKGICIQTKEEEEKNGKWEDKKKPGSDLLSRTRSAVPSAMRRFTVVFGMGTCGSRLSMATRKAIVCDAVCNARMAVSRN